LVRRGKRRRLDWKKRDSCPLRVRLRGINSVARTLKDGTCVTYWYAWKGGPRLDGQPGDREFIASYNRAVASLTAPAKGLLLNVLVKFQQTEEFRQLAARTCYTQAKHAHLGEQ
jgi:hypothetical protein